MLPGGKATVTCGAGVISGAVAPAFARAGRAGGADSREARERHPPEKTPSTPHTPTAAAPMT